MKTSSERIPVFGVVSPPVSLSLEGCVGWASNEEEALKIVGSLPETLDAARVMSREVGAEYHLGGVYRDCKVVQDEDGLHFSSRWGRYRFQDVFRAYLDVKPAR